MYLLPTTTRLEQGMTTAHSSANNAPTTPGNERVRPLGRSGLNVSALGMGCWAIGGVWTFNGAPAGWSAVDDDESIRALRRAAELGITLFDTAANYGVGHSERLLGRAFAGHREEVVLATKFGHRLNHADRSVGTYADPSNEADVARHLRADLHGSLRRLQTDYVDVYQLHVGELRIERALEARDVLEQLVDQGLIRTYGWSTDDVSNARTFAVGSRCSVIQHGLSVLGYEDPAMIELCEQENLAGLNRSPLGMGLLTGKFTPSATFGADDQRSAASWHPGFAEGRPAEAWLNKLAAVRDILTSDGRTLAQGALAWIWGRSRQTIPIPGFKTVAQVEENCGALDAGPLSPAQMAAVAEAINR